MKIIAWNINGLRSLLKTNNLDNLLTDEDPDLLGIGETKLSTPYDNINILIKTKYPKYKYIYWHPCKARNGYSGTSIFSKQIIKNIHYGLINSDIDNEGRVITIEFENIILIHVYTPNSGQALARLEWRTTIWDRQFEEHIKHYQKIKPVIVCGDLNVARTKIDLKNSKTKAAGYTIEERNSFELLLNNTKLIDAYRFMNGNKIEYSYWSYMRKSRDKNNGWRIYYFLIDNKLTSKTKECSILTDILGSDHAPVKLILDI